MSEEAVNHPKHYGGDVVYEAIKVIEAWGLGFALGNAVKYISRAGKKDVDKELEDLEKAAWYLNRRILQLKGDLPHLQDEEKSSIRLDRSGRWNADYCGGVFPNAEKAVEYWITSMVLDAEVKAVHSDGEDIVTTLTTPLGVGYSVLCRLVGPNGVRLVGWR